MLSYKEYDNALAVEIVIKGFVSTEEFEDTAKKLEAFIEAPVCRRRRERLAMNTQRTERAFDKVRFGRKADTLN